MRRQPPGDNAGREEPPEEEWDAHDPRRQRDQFAPPTAPCECFCLHCRRKFMSGDIWFQKINGSQDGFEGFWMCPTPNCSGAGFTFDIFPADPEHPANAGWFASDNEPGAGDWDDDGDEPPNPADFGDDECEGEYDPSEPQYQSMEEWAGDDDIEGEEWKFGLEAGEHPDGARPQWAIDEETKYDEPDRRPREVDWTERSEGGAKRDDDDIPF